MPLPKKTLKQPTIIVLALLLLTLTGLLIFRSRPSGPPSPPAPPPPRVTTIKYSQPEFLYDARGVITAVDPASRQLRFRPQTDPAGGIDYASLLPPSVTVNLPSDVGFSLIIPKDPAQYQKERAEYTAALNALDPTTPPDQFPVPPQPDDRQPLSLTDLRPGMRVYLTSRVNIKNAPVMEAASLAVIGSQNPAGE